MKNKIIQWVAGSLGIVIWVVVIWSLCKNANFDNPFDNEDLFLILSFILLEIYIFIVINEDNKLNDNKLENERINLFPFINLSRIGLTFFFVLFFFPLILSILGLIIRVLIFAINFWYYLLAIYILISLFVFLLSTRNIKLKFLSILLIFASIYFGYKVRNIVNVKFSIEFKNEKVF